MSTFRAGLGTGVDERSSIVRIQRSVQRHGNRAQVLNLTRIARRDGDRLREFPNAATNDSIAERLECILIEWLIYPQIE